jgi:two-component system nitrate/nitrite response regulator NarL
MNILIVDDHPLTCQGLAALLQASRLDTCSITSVHCASDARVALQGLPVFDWLFLDINLPDDPQHRFFHELCTTSLIDHTVLISAQPEHALIYTALAAGARGFIPKTADPELVLTGFAKILTGEFYVPPELADRLRHPTGNHASLRGLSPRLVEVQTHLLRGASNKVIARSLNISAHTVKEYVSSVLTFHGVSSRLDLVLRIGSARH